MSSRTFDMTLHVPYAHIDKMGFVYYAHYYVYFEMARASMFRELGLPYMELEEKGILLPVIASHCEYKKPARYDDEITVTIHNVEIRGALFHVDYEVRRGGERLAQGYTDHVCMSPKGRVMKPAPELKKLVKKIRTP
jgi:acyl-CoA thioester hydrolase